MVLREQLEALKVAARRNEPPPPLMFWGQPFNNVVVPPQFKELMVDSFDGSQDPQVHLQAFQTQVYISGEDDLINYKLYP
ncbi:hypothetical protein CR513_39367, partial [Mucuna pruriens]